MRKHLGAGLYLCGVCGQQVRTRGIYYSCKVGHLNRSRDAIDDFVRSRVVARLQKKDLKRRKKQADPTVKDAFSQRTVEQRARIARDERDYDAELIEGADLARIRDAARVEIGRLEAARLDSGTGLVLGPIPGGQRPCAGLPGGSRGPSADPHRHPHGRHVRTGSAGEEGVRLGLG